MHPTRRKTCQSNMSIQQGNWFHQFNYLTEQTFKHPRNNYIQNGTKEFQ